MKKNKSKVILFITTLLLAASLSQFASTSAKAAGFANKGSVSGNQLQPFCDREPEYCED